MDPLNCYSNGSKNWTMRKTLSTHTVKDHGRSSSYRNADLFGYKIHSRDKWACLILHQKPTEKGASCPSSLPPCLSPSFPPPFLPSIDSPRTTSLCDAAIFSAMIYREGEILGNVGISGELDRVGPSSRVLGDTAKGAE